MKLKRSFLKRKIRFRKWKDRTLFQYKPELFLDRFKEKVPAINAQYPEIKLDMSSISFVERADLPALAWGLKITPEGKALVNYGCKVHSFPSGIVEGTWDDDFEKFNFKDAFHFFGSGITVSNAGLVISSPTHFYEGTFLFHNKKTGVSYFSNSLSYVLKDNMNLLGGDFDEILRTIGLKNDEITSGGLFDLTTLLYDNSDFALHTFFYHNIILDGETCYLQPRTPANPQYKKFEEYRDYLLVVLNQLNSNSTSKLRDAPYPILVTLSSGYDSTAVASLLTDVGALESVTIDVNIAGNDDSGMEIAQYLGIKCHPCTHPLSVDNKIDNLGTFKYTESFADKTGEFLATIGHGDDIVFKAFESYLDGRAVYTGHSGDDLWSLKSHDWIGLKVDIINAKSLSEFRLRMNFFHIPLPVIGAVYPFMLYKINYQADMKSFWLQDIYNRPIPRRFVEDKGVPRGVFAKSKRSTNPYILNVDEHKARSFQLVMKRYCW